MKKTINVELNTYKLSTNKKGIHPTEESIKNWIFQENEEDEALLAHFVSKVGKKNGLTKNDIMYMFPYILRMLKSNITWSE